MLNPFFSVIIPTFNQSNFLSRALDSVVNQNFNNFEIIVIDNFSSDNTKKIVKSFKKKIIYKRIENKGIIAKSRNVGIQISKGKWLAFLDSDDLWSKNKLQEIYNRIKKENFDVICNDEWIKYENKSISSLWSYGPFQDNFYETLLRNGNCISTSASIIKKNFLIKKKIKFNENKLFVTAEDYEFFLNISKKRGSFFFLHKPLGLHLFHNKSASYNYFKHKKSLLSMLKYHVFKMQKFTLYKNKLWSEVKLNVELIEILNFFFKDFKRKKSISEIFKIIKKKPSKFLQIFLKDIFNKVKRAIYYYINYIIKKPIFYEKN